MINFRVKGTVIKQIGSYQAVADSLNYLQLNFALSADWQECGYIYIYTTNRADGSINYSQQLSGNVYTVPGTMITAPGFTFGLVGYDADDNVKITSQGYEVAVKRSGVSKNAIEPTTEEKSAFDQVVANLDTATDKLRYVFIKWAAAQPAADADLVDTPNAYLGIYCGMSATAPKAYTAYAWYRVKGETGEKGDTGTSGTNGVGIADITYQNTDSSGNNIYTIKLTDGRTYTFTAPRGAGGSGSGDMTAAVYDVNGKATDIYAYVDTKSLPIGGTTGQVLAKSSAANYAVGWVDATSGSSIDETKLVHLAGTETITGEKAFNAVSTFNQGLSSQFVQIPADAGCYLIIGDFTNGYYRFYYNNGNLSIENPTAANNPLTLTYDNKIINVAYDESNTSSAATVGFVSDKVNAKVNRSTNVNSSDTNYTTIMARGISLQTATPTSITNGCLVGVYEA